VRLIDPIFMFSAHTICVCVRVRICLCMFVRRRVFVCALVSVCERESDRVRVRLIDPIFIFSAMCVCVCMFSCVCVREKERVFLCARITA